MNPTASHPSPAYRVFGSWITTTSHARPVPNAPTMAKIGQSTPRKRKFGRACHGCSSPSDALARSAMTEMCAIVNESIAPNAYMLPRKLT